MEAKATEQRGASGCKRSINYTGAGGLNHSSVTKALGSLPSTNIQNKIQHRLTKRNKDG